MTIKAILFDFDDTLVIEEASAEEAFLAACELAREKYGVDPVELHKTLRPTAREIWQSAPTIDYCRAVGISSWEGLWAQFFGDDPRLKPLQGWAPEYRLKAWSAALAEFDVEDSQLANELADTFIKERRTRHIAFPETLSVLEKLRGNYPLGLITNGAPDIQLAKIDGSGIRHYFDSITISGEVGIGKPDPKIFDTALQALGSSVEDTLMVGNSLGRDVAGAQKFGMRAVWVNRTGATRKIDVEPYAEITSLEELQDILGSID